MNTIIRAASRFAFRPIADRLLVDRVASATGTIIQKKFVHNFPLTYDFARERIMLVLRLFDKIDPEKLTLDSHFIDDLGLDSLDHVEIIMEMEDEFLFEIPDNDAEKLMRPRDILTYITDHEEAYEELQKLHAHDHGHGHGHGHDNDHKLEDGHAHGGHQSATNMSGPQTTQTRTFCSWTAKRYASGGRGEDRWGKMYNTSFDTIPKKEVNFDDIQQRVMKVCSKYDKIDSTKLNESSHFVEDLGLDSLDHVEIMMELEDEFGLEIPDQDAEKLLRPSEIARYIMQKEEARSVTPVERDY